MRTSYRGALLGLAATAVAVAAAPAFAGCGAPSLQPGSYQGGSSEIARLQLANNGQGEQGDGQPIVGLWSISLVSGGAQIDWGYSEWHSDGTEIMNSGGHTPATGNFCLGVWRQTGQNRYHLKHFPLAYTPSGDFAARIILTEDVTVDPSGQNFSGHFTEDIYDTSGTVLQLSIPGTITGHRVLPN